MGIFEFMGFVFAGAFAWVLAPFAVIAFIFLLVFLWVCCLHYGAMLKSKFNNFSRK